VRNLFIFFVVLGFIVTVPSCYLFAQVGINTDNSAPDQSAGLDVKFNDKGILIPRMTQIERNAITNPANGLMVICSNCGTDGSLSIYLNGAWKTFSPCTIAQPAAGDHVQSLGQITWNWNAVPGATGYKWSTTPSSEAAADMGTGLSKTETGTACGVTYNRYVWAYNSCGESVFTMLESTFPATPPDAPAAGIHVPGVTSIVWKWNTVPGATGYKWSPTINYTDATDMGTATSWAETGLTCNNSYTRYVWSYNTCGNSAPVILNQAPYACDGSPCEGIPTVFYDNQTYNTVQIGSPNTGATNESGFSGHPAGFRVETGTFVNNGYYGHWWSSSGAAQYNAWIRTLNYNNSTVSSYFYLRSSGFSVRCLQGL
jgi:hypothetical protein